MKKYIAGFIAGVFATVGITAFADEVRSFIAEKATFEVYVAGEKFESEKPPVVIEGSTYLPLKATGEALGVDVTWNEKERRVEIGEMENQIVAPEPVQTNTNRESFGANIQTYRYRSDIIETDSRVQYALVVYRGEQYVDLKALASIVKRDGEKYYVQAPEREAVLVKTGMDTTKDAYFYMGSTFVKLSALGLKARIEGGTAYIEWAG